MTSPEPDDEGKVPLEPLDEAECWALLGRSGIGRLAVEVGRQPDIFPVNYVVDARSIVIRTAAGTKLAGAVLGGRVAFEIDAFDEETHSGWSVVVHGTAGEVTTLEDRLAAEELDLDPWAAGEKDRFLRVSPLKVTGRRLPGGGP
jgi:nitroimidazol reductase NimA-like FMN-containing flavoprotein (pyridoxamine 5'-phosphate oxidase superfamily)